VEYVVESGTGGGQRKADDDFVDELDDLKKHGLSLPDMA
jgi:hypothetical protein